MLLKHEDAAIGSHEMIMVQMRSGAINSREDIYQ